MVWGWHGGTVVAMEICDVWLFGPGRAGVGLGVEDHGGYAGDKNWLELALGEEKEEATEDGKFAAGGEEVSAPGEYAKKLGGAGTMEGKSFSGAEFGGGMDDLEQDDPND